MKIGLGWTPHLVLVGEDREDVVVTSRGYRTAEWRFEEIVKRLGATEATWEVDMWYLERIAYILINLTLPIEHDHVAAQAMLNKLPLSLWPSRWWWCCEDGC